MAEKLVSLKKKGTSGSVITDLTAVKLATNISSISINVSQALASAGYSNVDYTKLTSNNFFLRIGASIADAGYDHRHYTSSAYVSYDPSTGVLNVFGGYRTAQDRPGPDNSYDDFKGVPYVDVYCIFYTRRGASS